MHQSQGVDLHPSQANPGSLWRFGRRLLQRKGANLQWRIIVFFTRGQIESTTKWVFRVSISKQVLEQCGYPNFGPNTKKNSKKSQQLKWWRTALHAPGPYQLQALLLHLHLQPTPDLNIGSFMRQEFGTSGHLEENQSHPNLRPPHTLGQWSIQGKKGLSFQKIRVHPRFKGPEAFSFNARWLVQE